MASRVLKSSDIAASKSARAFAVDAMREHQFRRPSVEVVLWPEVSDRDRRVLDVPSGPAFAPRAVPRGLPRLPGPPQDEIGGMPFPFLDGDSGPRPERFDLLSAQLAPAGERRRVVVDASVFGDVCVALLD